MPRSDSDLVRQLHEQLEFLEASAHSYDEGRYHEAKRLATTTRILCHQTKSSNSLLGQLDLVSRLRFVNTNSMSAEAEGLRDASREPTMNYVTIFESGLAPAGGHPTGLTALRERAQRHEPLPFESWWNADVLRDSPHTLLGRRDIVLLLANKDGGAHVDPVLDDRYETLSRRFGLGTFGYRMADGTEVVIDTNPALPVMRQIAYELVETLRPIFGPVHHK